MELMEHLTDLLQAIGFVMVAFVLIRLCKPIGAVLVRLANIESSSSLRRALHRMLDDKEEALIDVSPSKPLTGQKSRKSK
jgi:hypothetical protein